MDYLIIGNSAAAVGAIEAIRAIDSAGNLTVVSGEREHVYSRPLIAHYLAGTITEERMAYRPLDFYERFRVKTVLGISAAAIDCLNNRIVLDDGSMLTYDRLLLATGSRVTIPSLPGLDLDGVGIFQTYACALKALARLKAGGRAVVIGAGLIGLRAAYGLHEAGIDVTIIELLPRVASRFLDQNGSRIIQGLLEKGGIRILTGCRVKEICGDHTSGVNAVLLDNGEKIDCRMVIVATGIVPNTSLVENTEVKINRGIIVNPFLQTSVNNIFAAGDVAETFDLARRIYTINANWPNAYEQGRYAGSSMAGLMQGYPGSVGMNALSLFRTPIISMGLFDPEAEKTAGVEIKIRENSTSGIYQKLIFQDNRLKGAILIGDIAYAGALNNLIREQTLVGIIKDAILEEKFQFYTFLRQKREKEVEGISIQWPENYSSSQRYEKSFNEESWTERERDQRNWR